MGHPFRRSNIFKRGSQEQRELARFPLQAVVLFSCKEHASFFEQFQSLFMRLHNITGENVVFFAVMAPPSEWARTSYGSRWNLYDYRSRDAAEISMDDDPLVREIARTFGVEWDELPVLVASPNLWLGEHCKVSTGSFLIERQLSALNDLVEEWGRPNLGLIQDVLQECSGTPSVIEQPKERFQTQLSTIYQQQEDFFQSFQSSPAKFFQKLLSEFEKVQSSLGSLFREGNIDVLGDVAHGFEQNIFDYVQKPLEDVVGAFLVPATFATRFRVGRRPLIQDFMASRHFEQNELQMLDSESKIFLETSSRIESFFSLLQGASLQDTWLINPFSRGFDLDYSPVASG
jgi:hypothetical protein